MADNKMVCIQMVMNRRMWWNIEGSLWNGLRSMNVVFTLGMTKRMSSCSPLAFLCLGQLAGLALSLSLTMSGHFTKMTNAKSIEAAQAKM